MKGHFQFSPQMFNWVEVGALAGTLKVTHTVVLKPLKGSLNCVPMVIVLL